MGANVRSHDGRSGLRHLGVRFKSQAFVLYVATNMALCAVLFAPWALPRETISGLLGRWKVEERRGKRKIGGILSCVVDTIYFWEPDHCVEVYKCERRAREILYPCSGP